MEHTEGPGMWGVTFSTQASNARECVLPRGFLPFQTFSVLFFSPPRLSKGRGDQKEKKSRRANRTQPSRLSLLEAKHAGTGRQSQMLVREPDSAADKVRSDRGLATKPGQQASKRVPKRKKCARLAALFRVLDDSDIDSESLSVTSRVFRRDCDPRGV